jgi:tetratricopeptide (TPR) repeat protein
VRRALLPCLLIAAGAAQAQTSPSPGNLAAARAAHEQNPTSLEATIWHARFVGYSDYTAAVAMYTTALERWPNDPWLLRHRGHRYISLRQFDAAEADLSRAYELTRGKPDLVEQDGQPNPSGIPTSTLQSNIRYHLALAQFLTGDFQPAAEIWASDAEVAKNLDQRAAATYWWVLALARGGNMAAARRVLADVRADWTIIENGSYHRLLLWMKGELPEAQLRASMTTPLERQTIGNGIAQWKFAQGDRAGASAARAEVLATGPSAAFGFIAAEQLRP